MLGAIAGDMIGSVHEFGPRVPESTPLFEPRSHFTDDTILTLATARCLLDHEDYANAYRDAFHEHRDQAWGLRFAQWADSESMDPYNSLGNGSAMRVSPIGFWARDAEEAVLEAKRSAEVTHDHPEGIRGAQAVAHAIVLARSGTSGSAILEAITARYGYSLDEPVSSLQQTARYNEICQGTVPPAIRIACEADSFEQAMRYCLTLDADTDTLACITGGIAEARFGVPQWIHDEVDERMTPNQRKLVSQYWAAVAERSM